MPRAALRRAELLRLNAEDLQQREGRWVFADMEGKENRIRTVTVPAAVKARIDQWLGAAELRRAVCSGRSTRAMHSLATRSGIRRLSGVW